MFQESVGEEENSVKEAFDREFKTNRRAEALRKYCMQSFHFHILRSLSHWEVFVSHKLWEEVKVQPLPSSSAFMSLSPRCWGAVWEDRARQAAGRGRKPSRLLKSRCCWSPDRWASTARRAPPGPGTHRWRSLIKPGRDLLPAVWRLVSATAPHASTPSWSCTVHGCSWLVCPSDVPPSAA